MHTGADTSSVTDNPTEERFELEVAGGTAILTYAREDGVLQLLHTEVPSVARGRGVGGRLVQAALEQARRNGEQVAPVCPFVKVYLRRHPEYQELVRQE